jgi:hypothetical protein
MGFFDRLFGKEKESGKPAADGIPCASVQELLERYGCIGLDRQTDFDQVIGQQPWNVNMKTGEITFGGVHQYPMQVIGTYSFDGKSWLWGWANEASGIKQEFLQECLRLKSFGERNHLADLTSPQLDAEFDDTHQWGMIACGFFGSSAYYVADYGQGALVVTMKARELDEVRKNEFVRMLTTFPRFIGAYDVDHRASLKYYAEAKGFEVTSNGNQLVAAKGKDSITAEFDGLGRMTSMTQTR